MFVFSFLLLLFMLMLLFDVIFRVDPGLSVEVSFHHFETEENIDIVRLYEGVGTARQLRGDPFTRTHSFYYLLVHSPGDHTGTFSHQNDTHCLVSTETPASQPQSHIPI